MRTIGGIKIPDKDMYKVMSTFKYELFSFIDGNRVVDHADRIEKSIRKSGLLVQPILVNQHMQIIEGQNRFECCKNLGLPIFYVVQEDIGLEEVKSLNSASKNWTTKNYIHSFAAGDKIVDYIYIEQLLKQFPWATQRVISFAINDFVGGTSSKIKDGTMKCDEVEYNRAVSALGYAERFRKYVDGVGGRKEFYIIAIMFCYFCEDVDNEYLEKKFEKYHKSLSPISDIKSAVLQIESKIYNYQMRSPREPISIVIEYERARRASKSNRRKEE